jgi:hypothetical protein
LNPIIRIYYKCIGDAKAGDKIMADDVKEVNQYRTFYYLYAAVSTCSQKFENLYG